ncbi:O-antigen polymerase [Thalassoroseus pseudoceratinae]|uniref:O-antigen polymerase n=1 Tax=Thalassoroseus pseudoceratinae TaxID=2713176 RepID=UPI001422A378|nr:O-antigen polymerase [Thalassoroseus pseudoceratinae]
MDYIAFLILAFVGFRDVCNAYYGPRCAYACIWAIIYAIGLLSPDLFRPISPFSDALMLLGHLGFLAGTWLCQPKQTDRVSHRQTPQMPVMPLWLTVCLSCVVLLMSAMVSIEFHGTSNALSVAAQGEIDRHAILKSSEEALNSGSLSSSLMGLSSALLMLLSVNAACCLKSNASRAFKVTTVSVTAIAILYLAIVTLAKAVILKNAIVVISIYLTQFHSKPRLKIFATATALIGLVFASWQMNMQFTNHEKITEYGIVERTEIYLVASRHAFGLDTDDEELFPRTVNGMAQYSLPIISKLLGRITGGNYEQNVYKDYVFVPHYINTYTWFYVFYHDLGIVGVIVFPLIMGAFSTWIFHRSAIAPYRHNLYLLALTYNTIVFSFFNFDFLNNSHIAIVVLLWCIYASRIGRPAMQLRRRSPRRSWHARRTTARRAV